MTTIKIAKRRLYKESDRAYTFTTCGYGGEFFSLPKSQINVRQGKIRINDVAKEEALVIDIPSWLFCKLEQTFKTMSKYQYKKIN
jgi:hypothetical protein